VLRNFLQFIDPLANQRVQGEVPISDWIEKKITEGARLGRFKRPPKHGTRVQGFLDVCGRTYLELEDRDFPQTVKKLPRGKKGANGAQVF